MARIVALAMVVMVSFVVVSPVAWWLGGLEGIGSSATAAAICLVGGILAMAVNEPFRAKGRALAGTLMAMGPRMGIPLIAALVGSYYFDDFGSRARFLCYLVVYFEIVLLVEVFLTTTVLERRRPKDTGR